MRPISALAPLMLIVGSTALAEEMANAEERTVAQISFESPCVSDEQFFRTLKSKHGVSREQVPFSKLSISAEGARFELELIAADGSSRSLFDSNCQTLVDSALVIVATQVHAALEKAAIEAPLPSQSGAAGYLVEGIDPRPKEGPDLPAEPQNTPPLLTAETAQRITSEEADKRPQAPNPEKSKGSTTIRLVPLATLGGGVSLAFHPSPAFFGEFGGGLRSGRWGSTLLFRYHFPSESLTTDAAGLRLESASARLALAYFPSPWLSLGLGPSLSWLSGRGVGVSRPESSVIWVASAEFDALVIPLRAKSWALGAGLRGFVTLNNPRFELDDGSPVYSIPRVGAGIFLHGIWSER